MAKVVDIMEESLKADIGVIGTASSARINKVIERCATAPDSPEKNLWVSVIQQAVSDLSVQKERREALSFISSKRFEYICGLLGLDYVFARELISEHGKRVVRKNQDDAKRLREDINRMRLFSSP